jgi:hypothetical protein
MSNGSRRKKAPHHNARSGQQAARASQPPARSRGEVIARARQSFERYTALARDAASAGNAIDAENFYQHAEHYLRTMRALTGDNEGLDEATAAGKGVSAS